MDPMALGAWPFDAGFIRGWGLDQTVLRPLKLVHGPTVWSGVTWHLLDIDNH
jgi:hypothetical protein